MRLLENGRLICPHQNLDMVGHLIMDDGKISSILPLTASTTTFKGERIDCTNKIITSGFSDVLAFGGLPDQVHRENLNSLSNAALAGGFLHVGFGAERSYDTPSVIQDLCLQAQRQTGAHLYVIAALTRGLHGKELSEIGLMQRAGAIALFQSPVHDSSVLRRALQYARPFKCPVILRPADLFLEAGGVMHEGKVATRIGLRGIPESAEVNGISTILNLARETECPVHLSHVTTARGVELVHRAKQEGLPVSAGVPARHLALTDAFIEDSMYDTRGHLLPPLRPESDRLALIDGVRERIIDCVFANHTSCTRVEKEVEFALSVPGAIGLETAGSVAYQNIADPMTTFRALGFATKYIFGQERSLSVDAPADIVIFDPEAFWTPGPCYHSKGNNEPLEGMTMKGRVIASFIAGNWMYRKI